MQKKNTAPALVQALIMTFCVMCIFVGLAVGMFAGFSLACLISNNPIYFQEKIDQMPGISGGAVLFFLIVGIIVGAILGIPLFIISVKPFFTRQFIIDLINKTTPEGMEDYNSLGWFFLDLIYPDDGTEGNESRK